MIGIYSDQAQEDIRKHVEYLIKHASPDIAYKFVNAIEEALLNLSLMPRMGRSISLKNPRGQGVRLWRPKGFDHYLMFYRQLPEGIELVRVIHGARDLPNEFGNTNW